MGGAAALVPRTLYDVLVVTAVVVRLDVVGCVVAFLSQQGGEALHSFGHRETGAHLLGTE